MNDTGQDVWDQTVSVGDAARALGLHRNAVYGMHRRGLLPGVVVYGQRCGGRGEAIRLFPGGVNAAAGRAVYPEPRVVSGVVLPGWAAAELDRRRRAFEERRGRGPGARRR
jgi:hypothetical protein